MSAEIPPWALIAFALVMLAAARWMFASARDIRRKGEAATSQERDLRPGLVIVGWVTAGAGLAIAVGAALRL